MCHDKYHGRRLDQVGVQDSLYQFLHDGYRLRTELLDPILQRLRHLHDKLSGLDTFRFYSSSLLVTYEGRQQHDRQQRQREPDSTSAVPGWSEPDTILERPQPLVEVQMIDFAHATYQGFHTDSKKHSGPDRGFLLGLTNLITFFLDLKQSRVEETH